jgi:hypothetical protein
MVKRVVAMLLGALAGAVLWTAIMWLRSPSEAAADPVAIEHCIQDAYVDCVGLEAPPTPEAVPGIAQACRDWLSEDAGLKALSQCLHDARRDREAMQIENFKRAQRIAAAAN